MLETGNYSNSLSIKTFLSEQGYYVKDFGNYLKTSAAYRGGTDLSSVTIYPNNLTVLDHVTGDKFSINTFFSKILNIPEDKVKEDLKDRGVNLIYNISEPKIDQPRIFSEEILKQLNTIYDYWIDRGINEDTLKKIGNSGLYTYKGIMNNRYLFCINNSKSQIVGLAGRSIDNNKVKWVLRGQKSIWCYPAAFSLKYIKEKNSVFLCESIGDALSLMECGINNVLVLFGLELNLSIINLLLKLNIGKIYISTNNDENNAGNNGAIKINDRLNKYFSYNQVKILHPQKCGDWNEVLVKYGKNEILEQLKEHIK